MIKIGELSKISNVSVKTIRYYEEEGLISPVEVDRWTNYRYYDDGSINRISQILYLKELGFSLKEIKNLDEHIIEEKIKSLNLKIKKFTRNIHTLSKIKKEKGEYIMKNFVNDETVIGKWKKLGVANSLENVYNGKIEKSNIFIFNELYFLPKGEEYWSLAWTKGTLFVNNRPMPYQIVDNKLVVGVVDLYTNQIDAYAVYEKVDNKEYEKSDIEIKDDVNIPFIKDEEVVGFWEVVDYIKIGEKYNPSKHYCKNSLFLKKYVVEPNGNLVVTFSNGRSENLEWSKGFIIDKNLSTVSTYKINTIDGEDYLVVEWKSGDYVYGGLVVGCYVFKRIK